MKSDIDALMQDRNFDAIMIMGNAQHNPAMSYFTGRGHVSNALLIKKVGEEPILFCNDMERDEAAKSGHIIRCFSEFPLEDYLADANGDMILASARRIQNILTDLKLTKGIISLYGQTSIGASYALFTQLQEILPDLKFVGEANENSLLMKAMETKDKNEIERIRIMGRITTKVVKQVADFLSDCDVNDEEILINKDGTPLKIGDVKNKINLWLAESGVENPHGTIFAIGHDAGVPHSSGNPDDLLKLGKTIVFDIYPCEEGGGYHYDFTRTWCLGYAPPEVMKLYQQVFSVHQHVIANLDLNAPFKEYQRLTCELFEKEGHPTKRSHKGTTEGYVHSLGHGVGLNIHERPWAGLNMDDDNRLTNGVVMTIEPGLYYPDKGMGVRLEDTLCVHEDGSFEILADYPLDLVLPMKKWKKK